MDLPFPCLTNNAPRLVARPIDFPIPDKLPKELEFVGQVRMWAGGKQPFENCSRLRRNAILKPSHLCPLPDSWIVHGQSLGIDGQIGGKVALHTFVAVDPARSCAGKARITLLNWADGEIWNGNVDNQKIRTLARCERQTANRGVPMTHRKISAEAMRMLKNERGSMLYLTML